MTKLINAFAYLSLGFALTSVAQELPRAPIDPTTSTQAVAQPQPAASGNTKFDLDFPGGTAKQMVDAINAARGKPVNVVFPANNDDQWIPAFKVKHVDVDQLFSALVRPKGNGFVTPGSPSDDSVWYFQSVVHFADEVRVCRFYSLAPYLESGFTIDDITTAIQTGWRMSGVSPLPQMNYHKETKLLIAVGKGIDVQVIDAVLTALNPARIKTPSATPPAANEHPKPE